jgi:hypothetical protein
LGIAEETARNLLKRVFSKVGISRQSELAALLSKLVVSDKKNTTRGNSNRPCDNSGFKTADTFGGQ